MTQQVDVTADAARGRSGGRPQVELEADSPTAIAVRDILQGARAWYLWGLLGWQDIRHRYRRSTIGPFWITISMGVMVGTLGILYASLFRIEIADYLPYITLGFLVWGLISGLIADGCLAFVGAEAIIKHVSIPLSVHVYRTVWRNLIIFAHNAVIFLVVAVIFALPPHWTWVLAAPGLMMLCLNGTWIALLLGLVSARFRDVPQIVASIVQVAFFVTPIIWKPELIPDKVWLLQLNPFYHLIDVVRLPLLGQMPPAISWIAVIAMTVAGWWLTLIAYSRYRWRIAYWI